jgi:lipoic acid synthetase
MAEPVSRKAASEGKNRTKHVMGEPRKGKPSWLKVKPRAGKDYFELRRLFAEQGLNTICAEARCPNTAECWNHRTATFLILGDRCTRRCTFCNVGYGWSGEVDRDEPRRLAEGVATLGLRHVVLTSVDRDDLPDGGASVFVECVQRLRALDAELRIELLIPDFAGKPAALEAVLDASPEVLAHNLETVHRLYPGVRPRSSYRASLDLLRRVGERPSPPVVKTGIMLGLGEEEDELVELMEDVREAGVQILTIGQYLQPSPRHHRVERFYTPEEFAALADRGRDLGLPWVESGPLVRSSYHAARQHEALG